MAIANKDIGAEVDIKQSISIQNVDASADVNGASADRTPTEQLYHSGSIICSTGSATGSPSAQSHVFKLQESTDDSTWTDVSGATVTITADDTTDELDVNFTALDRYLRVVYDSGNSSFTGGSTPANDVAAYIMLGGAQLVPHA